MYVGDMDNHYLNLAVYAMEAEASKLTNPKANFTFEYGRPMKPHGWQPMTNAELVQMMDRFRSEHLAPSRGSPPSPTGARRRRYRHSVTSSSRRATPARRNPGSARSSATSGEQTRADPR